MEIMTGKLAIGASLLVISLLFGRFAWFTSTPESSTSQRFEEKVNLALRRTGHRLLLASGDSTSRITAVKKTAEGTYVLQLSRAFNYSQLPSLLQESFDLHGIKNNYDVAVIDCKTNELQLGYNFLDYSKSKEVACIGREQLLGCNNVKVTFASSTNPSSSTNPVWWTLGLGLVLVGVSYSVWSRKKTSTVPAIETPHEQPIEKPTRLTFGASSMDVENQLLYIANTHHNLTYREAKLLHLFVKNKNQLLEREFILKSVWEDEGIIVGRSIDVFVSRLRKLLQEDTSLKIVAVHGVGYRLEVTVS
ncbi:DNA-binding winged helix-turn-helix (wHTH) protein [Runella defluvii]|uniref:DNA-binding winged helix-turn-helix (WHTH) protein n=1 Tax=Runella defluvii TaxID=370973 RepID=A0A7W5ZPC7_9BACT|nr:winged helix-turn-helix domain-containing protein [Runella defluvii]MBB3840295.1 DNA-binding winged helix-turn-helix (wHTH) protein [Runella defluvii]